MLSITNPTLKTLILNQIVEAIDNRESLGDLIDDGLSPEFIDMMRHRPARDLNRVSQIDALRFRVTFDEGVVVDFLNRIDVRRHDSKLCEYFVRNGAPLQVICALFRISASDVRELRTKLLPPDRQLGHSAMPPAHVRDRVHERWRDIKQRHPQEPFRESLYRLHQSFPEYFIDALCDTLNEFADGDEILPKLTRRTAAARRSQCKKPS